MPPRRNHFRRTQQRTYAGRRYKNPHLREKTLNKWKITSAVILTGASLIFFIILLLTHQKFSITTIEVKGIEYIDKPTFEQVVSTYLGEKNLFLKKSNRFLFSSDDVSNILLDTFALASVETSLQEGSVHIYLEERTSHLFWQTQGDIYVIDLEGIVVREIERSALEEKQFDELPRFVDKNNVPVTIGSPVLTPDEISNLFVFLDLLESMGIEDVSIAIDRLAGKWMNLTTQLGFEILFNVTGDIQEQANHLKIILTSQIDDIDSLEYIDVRFGDKVYYK